MPSGTDTGRSPSTGCADPRQPVAPTGRRPPVAPRVGRVEDGLLDGARVPATCQACLSRPTASSTSTNSEPYASCWLISRRSSFRAHAIGSSLPAVSTVPINGARRLGIPRQLLPVNPACASGDEHLCHKGEPIDPARDPPSRCAAVRMGHRLWREMPGASLPWAATTSRSPAGRRHRAQRPSRRSEGIARSDSQQHPQRLTRNQETKCRSVQNTDEAAGQNVPSSAGRRATIIAVTANKDHPLPDVTAVTGEDLHLPRSTGRDGRIRTDDPLLRKVAESNLSSIAEIRR